MPSAQEEDEISPHDYGFSSIAQGYGGRDLEDMETSAGGLLGSNFEISLAYVLYDITFYAGCKATQPRRIGV